MLKNFNLCTYSNLYTLNYAVNFKTSKKFEYVKNSDIVKTFSYFKNFKNSEDV